MRRKLGWLGIVVFVLAAGCATSPHDQWRWPWVKPSALAEEYNEPPLADARYSEPPTLPREVMKPGLRPVEVVDPRRAPPGLGGAGSQMPGARPSSPGNFMY